MENYEPTEYLRFVERHTVVATLPDGRTATQTVRILQQWWQRCTMEARPPGEWRDVPVQEEINECPC